MDDRLSTALNIAIAASDDDKVKRTLALVMILDTELYSMDCNDWEEYSSTATFQKEMADYFKEV